MNMLTITLVGVFLVLLTFSVGAQEHGRQESESPGDAKRMKVIAVEEHFLNAAIAEATREEIERTAHGNAEKLFKLQ